MPGALGIDPKNAGRETSQKVRDTHAACEAWAVEEGGGERPVWGKEVSGVREAGAGRSCAASPEAGGAAEVQEPEDGFEREAAAGEETAAARRRRGKRIFLRGKTRPSFAEEAATTQRGRGSRLRFFGHVANPETATASRHSCSTALRDPNPVQGADAPSANELYLPVAREDHCPRRHPRRLQRLGNRIHIGLGTGRQPTEAEEAHALAEDETAEQNL
mmetsp:Transcript_26902/g.64559  ORF Transcript_26902/g.64559 Transcript_26902/m.64559 type:complete len:218 (+) Transcript_26902:201-854(+)